MSYLVQIRARLLLVMMPMSDHKCLFSYTYLKSRIVNVVYVIPTTNGTQKQGKSKSEKKSKHLLGINILYIRYRYSYVLHT